MTEVPASATPAQEVPDGAGEAADAPAEVEPEVAVATESEAKRATVDVGLEGLKVESADGKHGIKFGLLARTRHIGSFGGGGSPDSDFSIAMLRPVLSGHIFGDRVRYFIQAEVAGTQRLLDAEFDVKIVDGVGVTVGQMLTPFTRAFLTPVPKLQMADFGLVNDAFRINRDVGFKLHAAPGRGIVEGQAGLYSGDGFKRDTSTARDINPLFVARVAVNPLGPMAYDQTPSLVGEVPFRVAIGANAYTNVVTASPPEGEVLGANERMLTLGGDVALQSARVMLLAEGFWRRSWTRRPELTPAPDMWGSYAQAGVFVWPKRVELVARAGVLDRGLGAGREGSYEGGLNGYIAGNHLKLQLRYGCLHTAMTGCRHLLTTQAQVWF
ncbi:MAG: porin [Nannocystaceae bacterium]